MPRRNSFIKVTEKPLATLPANCLRARSMSRIDSYSAPLAGADRGIFYPHNRPSDFCPILMTWGANHDRETVERHASPRHRFVFVGLVRNSAGELVENFEEVL